MVVDVVRSEENLETWKQINKKRSESNDRDNSTDPAKASIRLLTLRRFPYEHSIRSTDLFPYCEVRLTVKGAETRTGEGGILQ